MVTKVFTYTILGFLGISASVFGQSQIGEISRTEEVLRFAQPSVAGSARIQGLGGAGTALGGDVSSIYINPAGLGFYKKSDFSFSPGIGVSSSNVAYGNNNNQTRNKASFNINNLSAVFASKKEDYEPGAIRSWAFGLGYNRSANFNQILNYAGTGNSSYTNYLVNQANGRPLNYYADLTTNPAPIRPATDPSMLAYNTYLINANYPYNNANQTYQANYGNPITSVNQSYNQNYKGGVNEFMVSGGVNLKDKLYLGASAGLEYGRYRQQKSLSEAIINTTTGVSPLLNYSLDDNVKIDALGTKLNVGAIWRVVKVFQIGARFSTPTIYRFKEQIQYTNNVNFNNYTYVSPETGSQVVLNNQNDQTAWLKSKYNVSTPWKAAIGGTFLYQQLGLITAEAEYVDYRSFTMNAKANSDNTNMAADSKKFSQNYTSALNIRGGIELAFGKVRLRGGYAMYGNPYSDSFNGSKLFPTQAFTGGLGYRNDDYYLDFAYVLQKGEGQYLNYTDGTGRNIATINSYTQQNLVVTGGILF